MLTTLIGNMIHAMDILVRKRIEELSNSTLEPSESTVYETLKKLEKLKLIEGFWAKSPYDGAPVSLYTSPSPRDRG